MRQQSHEVSSKIYNWIVQRPDGVGFASTSHDQRIRMGATVLEPDVDMRPNEIHLHEDMVGSSLEIQASFNKAAFSEEALVARRWKGSRLKLLLADWASKANESTVCEGVLCKLRADRSQLSITVDLMPENASRPPCIQTSPECRAVLGDKDCRVDMRTRKQRVTVNAISKFGVSVDGVDLQRYTMGRLRWTSGMDCGLEQKIIGVSDQELLLHEPSSCNAVIGDRAIVTEGCDGYLETCSSRFENVLIPEASQTCPGLKFSCVFRVLEPHQRALQLLGVPFRFQGRNASIGLDCLGVVTHAYDLPCNDVPRYRITDGTWEGVIKDLSCWFEPLEVSLPQNGDVIVVRLPRTFHFGIVSDRYLIHADIIAGKVVRRRLPQHFGPACRIFRYRGAN